MQAPVSSHFACQKVVTWRDTFDTSDEGAFSDHLVHAERVAIRRSSPPPVVLRGAAVAAPLNYPRSHRGAAFAAPRCSGWMSCDALRHTVVGTPAGTSPAGVCAAGTSW